jgi:hypothetical protein
MLLTNVRCFALLYYRQNRNLSYTYSTSKTEPPSLCASILKELAMEKEIRDELMASGVPEKVAGAAAQKMKDMKPEVARAFIRGFLMGFVPRRSHTQT